MEKIWRNKKSPPYFLHRNLLRLFCKGGRSLKKSIWLSILIGILLLISIAMIGLWLINRGMTPNEHRNMDMGTQDEVLVLQEDKAEKLKPLQLPKILAPSSKENNTTIYDIEAKSGEASIKSGEKTRTLGYNGNYLGPVIRLQKGEEVTFRTKNSLDEETSFHWHGLVVPDNVDGGPNQIVQANSEKSVNFQVSQDAATLWFHPHPEGKTAKQVYEGLAGLIYIEDNNEKSKNLPSDYGKNDFPVVIQDRNFTARNQFDYETDQNSDGTQGENLVINGTIRPYIEVKYDKIRLRLLNGSNAREYKLKMSNDTSFTQIATDGGFLEKPATLKSIRLAPGERSEIILDVAKEKGQTLELKDGNTNVLTFKIANSLLLGPPLPKELGTKKATKDPATDKVEKIELSGMGTMVRIDGKKFNKNRIDKVAKQGEEQIFEITNQDDMMGGMNHPFHIHGTQFQIVSRNGKEVAENERGLKDTVLVAPNEKVQIKIRFTQKGLFVYHCHNLEHEENGMMGQINVI